MKEIVVDVMTLKQWKSTLDVWFKQGHTWLSGDKDKDYHEEYFDSGVRKLLLTRNNNILKSPYTNKPFIKYADFMSQQKEDNNMETYYVTREQYDLIEELYGETYPLDELLNRHDEAKKLFGDFAMAEGNAVLRYLGDDASIEFKVKEQLYRLSRIDDDGDSVYMKFGIAGTPTYTSREDYAFTATLYEITNWYTPAWEIEEVK